MERSTFVKWALGATCLVFFGVLVAQQRQIVNSQREIIKALQDMKAPAAAVPVLRPSAAPPVTDLTLSVEGAAIKGRADAKVTVIEYSDFQCPYCGRYVTQTYPQVDKEYIATGKIRYAFRHYPLERLHPLALKAGIAGECARRQDKFWPMHDRLFGNQAKLQPADLTEHARALGLDMKAFQTCVDGKGIDTIREDQATGGRGGITGTPTFFVGISQPDGSVHVVDRIVGAGSIDSFRAALDKVLASPQAH